MSVVSSDPAYRSAFTKMIKDPQFGHLTLEPEEQRVFAAAQQSEVRTAMSTSGANGGFLIPFALDPSIQLTNTGTANPFRGIGASGDAGQLQCLAWRDEHWCYAEWVSEAGESTDASLRSRSRRSHRFVPTRSSPGYMKRFRTATSATS